MVSLNSRRQGLERHLVMAVSGLEHRRGCGCKQRARTIITIIVFIIISIIITIIVIITIIITIIFSIVLSGIINTIECICT